MHNKIEVSTAEVASFEHVMKLLEGIYMDDSVALQLRQFANQMRVSLGGLRPFLQEVPNESEV